MSFELSPEIATAQAQAQAQRQQVEQARQQVEEAQRKAEEQRQKLQQARESLPERQSRRALTQKYAGLQGRKVRQQIKGAEEEIESKQGEVKQYEETVVNPARQQVEQADTELKAYEAQVAEASANEQGYYTAQKLYDKKVPLQFVDDPYVRKYLKEMYEQASSQAEYQQKLIDNPELLQAKVDVLVKKGFSEEKAFAKLGFKLDTSQLDRTTKVQIDTKLADIKTLGLSASMGISSPTTFRNILTGDMISARVAPKGYVPVNVEFNKVSSRLSTPINIKTPEPIKNNGISLVTAGAISLSSGDSMGLPSDTQPRNIVSFIRDRFNSGFQKATQEAPKVTIGGESFRVVEARSTGTISTVKPNIVIPEYEYQTSKGNIPQIGGDTSFVSPKTNVEKVKQVSSNLFTDTFKITPEEVTTNVRQAVTLKNIGGLATGVEGLGILAERKITESGFGNIPTQNVTISEPYSGTIRTDLLTGRTSPYNQRQVEVKGYNPIASAVGSAVPLAILATPIVGEAVIISYGARGVSKLKEPKLEYGERPEGISDKEWEDYKISVDQVNKSNRLNAFLDIGLAISPIALKGTSKVFGSAFQKIKVTKASKYTSPESFIYRKQTSVAVPTIESESVPYLRNVKQQVGDQYSLATLPEKLKVKGASKTTQVTSGSNILGEFSERRFTGKLEFGFDGLKPYIRKKPETFMGTFAKDAEGNVVEVLNLPKGMKRVSEFKAGESEGVIKLLNKEGKVISSNKVKTSNLLGDIKEKTRTSKIAKDFDTGQALVVTTGKAGNKKVGQVTTAEGERYFGKLDNLQARKVSFQSKETLTAGMGKTNQYLERELSGFSDIISVSPKKAKVVFNVGGKRAELRKQVKPEIKYGKDEDIDRTIFIQTDKGTISGRQISSNTNRQFTPFNLQESSAVFVNPKYSKNIKIMQEVEKAKLKQAREFAKKNPIFEEARLENVKIQDTMEAQFKQSTRPSEVSDLSKVDNDFINGQTLIRQGRGEVVGQKEIKEIMDIGAIVRVESPSSLIKEVPKQNLKDIPIAIESIAKSATPLFKSAGIAKVYPALKDNMGIDIKSKVMTRPSEKSIISISKKIDNKQQSKTLQPQKDLIRDLARNIQKPQVREQLKLQIKQLQLQKTKQQTKQAERPVLKTTKQTKRTQIKQPRLKLPPIPESKAKAKDFTTNIDSGEFKAFVRKKGKDIELGTFSSKEKATEQLIGKLRGSLAASGFLESGGKKVKVSDLGNLGAEFGRGKREEFRVVQLKNRRFSTKPETSEAQIFRKKSKGGFF